MEKQPPESLDEPEELDVHCATSQSTDEQEGWSEGLNVPSDTDLMEKQPLSLSGCFSIDSVADGTLKRLDEPEELGVHCATLKSTTTDMEQEDSSGGLNVPSATESTVPFSVGWVVAGLHKQQQNWMSCCCCWLSRWAFPIPLLNAGLCMQEDDCKLSNTTFDYV